MRKTLPFIVACGSAAWLSAANLPLVANHLVTGPSSHVELTNTGTRAVTAWSVAITTHPEGRTHREVQSGDAYLAEVTRDLPRSSPHLDWILPGQSRQLPLDPQPADATAEVLAVVLDDGTALGEPGTLTAIFDHRIAERDALHKVVDIFNAVLPTEQGAAALQELRMRFSGVSQADESTPYRSAREAVNAFSQKAAVNADEADHSLRTYAAFVQRQYDVAVKHAVRK